jgi:membrane-bound metal-dependent hydrolase YbcI (DUF457 family)
MHITVSSLCGVAYGAATVQPLGFPTETGLLAAGVTAVGGMLPDLDSGSGRPVREMFGLAAVIVPLMLVHRMMQAGVSHEGILAALLFGYLVIRYVASEVFKRLTVHRGMYHSIPAMLISGLIVYLAYHSPDRNTRLVLACGVMIGFLSHLVLDEIYSVDWRGMKPKLKSSAGSAVKFFSPSLFANVTCYLILGVMLYLAYLDYQNTGGGDLTFWGRGSVSRGE